MSSGLLTRSVLYASTRVPGVRRIPALKLLAAAELAMLTFDHFGRLERGERRRLLELIKIGRGRRRNLSESERAELATLIARVEPRLLAGHAMQKLSPVPLPRRLLFGPAKPR